MFLNSHYPLILCLSCGRKESCQFLVLSDCEDDDDDDDGSDVVVIMSLNNKKRLIFFFL